MASFTIGLSSNIILSSVLVSSENPEEFFKRVVELINNSLLQRDDCIISDRYVLRTNLRAALGDIAETYTVRLSQFFDPVLGVKRMHLERCNVNKKPWTNKLIVEVMLS